MKSVKLMGALLLLLAAGIGSAWADRGHWRGHGHGRIGIYFGPYWGPGYYGAPYYYPPAYPVYSPPVVIERTGPTVYVEQQPVLSEPIESAPQPGYWYYCQSAKGYYPHIQECPEGWQKIAPQPSARP